MNFEKAANDAESALPIPRRNDGANTMALATELLDGGQFGLAVVVAQCHLESTLRSGGSTVWLYPHLSALACGPATAALARRRPSHELRSHLRAHDSYVRGGTQASLQQTIDSIELVSAICSARAS